MTDAVIVGWLFIVIGVAMFVSIGALILLHHRSRRWPTVPGRVLSSEVIVSGRLNSRRHRLGLTYAYEVAGRRYEGTRFSFGDSQWGSISSRDIVERLRAAHAPDTAVSVYYEPRCPRLCTLNRKMSDMAYWALGAAVLLAWGGVGAIFGWVHVS